MNWFKELIKKLTPCNHEYEIVAINKVYWDDCQYPVGAKYIQRCKECGKMKVFKTY